MKTFLKVTTAAIYLIVTTTSHLAFAQEQRVFYKLNLQKSEIVDSLVGREKVIQEVEGILISYVSNLDTQQASSRMDKINEEASYSLLNERQPLASKQYSDEASKVSLLQKISKVYKNLIHFQAQEVQQLKNVLGSAVQNNRELKVFLESSLGKRQNALNKITSYLEKMKLNAIKDGALEGARDYGVGAGVAIVSVLFVKAFALELAVIGVGLLAISTIIFVALGFVIIMEVTSQAAMAAAGARFSTSIRSIGLPAIVASVVIGAVVEAVLNVKEFNKKNVDILALDQALKKMTLEEEL